MKVLLAEDDMNLGRMLSILLKQKNINVTWCQNGREAYEHVYRDGFDVLILDWMMPEMDGLTLCSKLREEEYQGKIIMLTAKDTVADKVRGLSGGADDYLVKPFELEELIARLHALTRRQGVYSNIKLCHGELVLESATNCLFYQGKMVELRPREFKLMEILLRNHGMVLPRELLQERIWGIESDVTDNNLDVQIRMLRKKLQQLSDKEFIKTVRGVGYCVE